MKGFTLGFTNFHRLLQMQRAATEVQVQRAADREGGGDFACCTLFSALIFFLLLLLPVASADFPARFNYNCLHKNGMSDIASTRAHPFARHPIVSSLTVVHCCIFM
jgi:hypothetical protein